jgi:hypothetical protein
VFVFFSVGSEGFGNSSFVASNLRSIQVSEKKKSGALQIRSRELGKESQGYRDRHGRFVPRTPDRGGLAPSAPRVARDRGSSPAWRFRPGSRIVSSGPAQLAGLEQFAGFACAWSAQRWN